MKKLLLFTLIAIIVLLTAFVYYGFSSEFIEILSNVMTAFVDLLTAISNFLAVFVNLPNFFSDALLALELEILPFIKMNVKIQVNKRGVGKRLKKKMKKKPK